MNNRLIYALVDPISHKIRYVGLSTRGLVRPREHWEPGRLKDPTCHKQHWLNGLIRRGLIPIIIVVQSWEHISDEQLGEAEAYWISYFRQAGCSLTNTTDGGSGTLGHVVSEKTKRKISSSMRGKLRSKEHCDNISKAKKGKSGKPWSEERKARGVPWRKGSKHSEETKKKMSKAFKGREDFQDMLKKGREAASALKKGRPLPEEHKRKISASLKGRVPWNKGRKIPEETRAKISASMRRFRQKQRQEND